MTDTEDSATPVVDLIHGAMPRMSVTDRRIAHVLLADLPRGALGTASELAATAEVSTASVVRFCRRIGFAGFAELGSRVRAELSRSATSPVDRARTVRPGAALDTELEHRANLVRAVMTSVPTAEIDRVLDLLVDPARTVLTAGGSLSHLAARYLQLQLRHVRPRVLHVADPDHADIGTVLDLRRRDMVILFDFRRYEPRTQRLAARAKERGASVVLITDAWLSPIAKTADIVLPLDAEAGFLDSLTPAFALVESLVPALAARLGDTSLRQMDLIEATRATPE